MYIEISTLCFVLLIYLWEVVSLCLNPNLAVYCPFCLFHPCHLSLPFHLLFHSFLLDHKLPTQLTITKRKKYRCQTDYQYNLDYN